jgi:PRTRC genetic system protein C
MTVNTTTRIFALRGQELPDPCPNGTLDDVRKAYAAKYPEILNAEFGAPVVDGSVLRYEITTKLGTKG